MPKDAAYYDLLVKSRRVQRDTSLFNCICGPSKSKSKKGREGSRKKVVGE
jgi:hypothetical protein